MSEEILVTLHVNGHRHVVGTSPKTTLLKVLRDELHLTGTKLGCGMGDCGACTVLVGGKPINACLVLAVEVSGKQITTIEGLGENGELHPLQKAFVKNAALQCGY